jgi:DNA-binding IclR family transcriptional regulator
MSETGASFHDAFDRLQKLLLTMRTGDELGARDAARLTGLAEPTCRTVLERLAKAGLMSHDGQDRFVRVEVL